MAPKKNASLTPDYWLQQKKKATYHAWAGLAFEALCLKHVNVIVAALDIKTAESISSWRTTARNLNEMGTQIDLLIDRSDDATTLCEIKYTNRPFELDTENKNT